MMVNDDHDVDVYYNAIDDNCMIRNGPILN